MGTSATRAKQKYNEKNYVQLNLKISPELKKRLDELKGAGSYPGLLTKALDALDGGLEAENRELKKKFIKRKLQVEIEQNYNQETFSIV